MSSKRQLKKKSCLSKKFYSTEEEAHKAVEMQKNFGNFDLHYYKCPFCKNYHMGHPRRSGNRNGFRRGIIKD